MQSFLVPKERDVKLVILLFSIGDYDLFRAHHDRKCTLYSHSCERALNEVSNTGEKDETGN